MQLQRNGILMFYNGVAEQSSGTITNGKSEFELRDVESGSSER